MEKLFNKKTIGIIIVVLLLLNILFAALYVNKSNQYKAMTDKYNNIVKKCYSLEGNSGAWTLENSSILLSDTMQYVDGGTLKYVGSPNMPRVDFYEANLVVKSGSKEEIVSSTAMSSNVPGGINVSDKSITLANVYSPIDRNSKNSIKDLGSFTCCLKIKYTISDQNYESTINLKVNEIALEK